jgi:hypothetical protein
VIAARVDNQLNWSVSSSLHPNYHRMHNIQIHQFLKYINGSKGSYEIG